MPVPINLIRNNTKRIGMAASVLISVQNLPDSGVLPARTRWVDPALHERNQAQCVFQQQQVL